MPYKRILKNIKVNEVTDSYDDIITKTGSENFTVKPLLFSKKMKCL